MLTAVLDWPAPVGPEEEALYALWCEDVKRSHGRTAKAGFVPMWKFEPRVEAWVAAQLATVYRRAPRPIVHVCSGSSPLGDVRIDIAMRADVKGTVFQLPVRDGAAGTVLADVPWRMPYHLRLRANRELARILKPDGLFVAVQPWFPDPCIVLDHEESRLSRKPSAFPDNPLLLMRGVKASA